MKHSNFAATLLVVLLPAAALGQPANQIKLQHLPRVDHRVLMRDYRAPAAVAEQDQQQAVARDGKGPKEQPIELAQLLNVSGLSDLGLGSLQEIANLSLVIYPDANKDSGLFYYRPRQYFLHWTPEDQYYLAIDYKPEATSQKNVVINARLTPGPVGNDVQVLERLLKAHLRRQPAHLQPPNPEDIRILPLPARYEARFAWEQYGVDAEDITVTGIDPDTRQFGLLIQTTVPTKELLLGKLGDANGLDGNVYVEPQQVTTGQPALAPFPVVARLKLADSEAYGRASFRRLGGEYSTFRNPYGLPVVLKTLAYLKEDGGRLVLRGYDLGSRRLLPGDTAKIPNVKVTEEIASSAVVRAWYAYTIENDASYRLAILDALTGGVGAVPVTNVDIQIVRSQQLFEQYDLFKVVVVVRSEYFDPNPDSSGQLENGYEFSADTERFDVAPLYRPEGAGEPLYEYKIGLITNDGMPHQDPSWRRPLAGFTESIFIGSSQIEEVLAQ